MVPRKCTIRYGTSIWPFFAKLIDVVPPTPSDFADSRVFPTERLLESPEDVKLRRPSLSAVLSAIGDQKALYLWQKAQIDDVGLAAFKSRMTERMVLGTKAHSKCEELLKTRADSTKNEQDLWKIIDAEKDAAIRNFAKSALPLILEIQKPAEAICEKRVRHPKLAFQGRFDALVRHNDSWCILDWKTAPAQSAFSKQGEESLSYIGYVRQLAAYASAFNNDARFESAPMAQKALLVSLKENGDPAEIFQISGEELETTMEDVKKKLEEFWNRVTAEKGDNVDFAYKPS